MRPARELVAAWEATTGRQPCAQCAGAGAHLIGEADVCAINDAVDRLRRILDSIGPMESSG